MKNEYGQQDCPLCGNSAVIFENEISTVECQKCGNYSYHISVHPLLNESNLRNEKILEVLAGMSIEKNGYGEKLMIDLAMYQELEKTRSYK